MDKDKSPCDGPGSKVNPLPLDECELEIGTSKNLATPVMAAVSDVEKMAQQDVRPKERAILIVEGELEHLEQQAGVLNDRCASISQENRELLFSISEEEDGNREAQAGYRTYRQKMVGYRAAVLQAASQMEAHKGLQERREQVRMLTQKKEELRGDLDNPNGSTVQEAKREVDALKGQVCVKRETIAESKEKLQKELETNTQLMKDIEIQNRRYEAIMKRLHSQLSRAQAVHRQMSEDVYHMERQLAELKKQLESSEDSGH